MASKDSTTEYKFLPLTPQMKDLTGQKFGRLVALGVVGRQCGHATWLCECECGKPVQVTLPNLLSGGTKSCGCLKNEASKARFTTHGKSGSREYQSYNDMKKRCYNKKGRTYHHYGGRGITVCARWRSSFETFYSDMGPCPEGFTLDRRNNSGNYTPSNCQWADHLTQVNNARSNVRLTHHGATMNVSQWAIKLGIHVNTLRARLKILGWSVEKTLSTPVTQWRHK